MEKSNYNDSFVVWYKSEFIWFLFSLVWQLIWGLLIGRFGITENLIWILLIGSLFSLYFIVKAIIYAWIINPKQWYIKKWKQLLSFFKL